MNKPPIKKANKIGKKFGLLTVISVYDRIGGKLHYKCICDCGKIRNVFTSYLKENTTGPGTVWHCGDRKHSPKSTKWEGCGDISGEHLGRIKRHARIANREFNLSVTFLWDLFIKQNKKCALSGLDIEFSRKLKDGTTTASLDRIDSSKGYIQNNVQWVHKDINRIKQNLDQEKFIELCKMVAKENI